MQVIDLTQPLSPETPVHPKDSPVATHFPVTHEAHGMAVSALRLSSHAGTHMDAPFHMLPQGATLDAYPVSRFVGPAVVLDVRGRGPALQPEDLAVAEEAAGGLRPGDFALLWTGWDEHFGASDWLEHPYLSGAAAVYLRDRGVTLVGADIPSMDSSAGVALNLHLKEMDLSAHLTLLAADILIVENLTGLGRLAGRRAMCAILPLRTVGAEGSPVRAVAWVEE